MSSDKEFTRFLDLLCLERMRVRLKLDRGQIVTLVFQYESYINGKWREIVRYDTAHGFFHRDFILPNGEKEKKRIEIADLTLAATFAEQDIKDKWEFYKAKYLALIKN